MPMDFTVIQAVRQRFGEVIGDLRFELEAPWVGLIMSYPFSCPNVDPRQQAVLQLESLGIDGVIRTVSTNELYINQKVIPGGLSVGGHDSQFIFSVPIWKTHSLIVPENTLKESGNFLTIISGIMYEYNGHVYRDNFIIDNVVIFYKTRTRVAGGTSTSAASGSTRQRSRTGKKPEQRG